MDDKTSQQPFGPAQGKPPTPNNPSQLSSKGAPPPNLPTGGSNPFGGDKPGNKPFTPPPPAGGAPTPPPIGGSPASAGAPPKPPEMPKKDTSFGAPTPAGGGAPKPFDPPKPPQPLDSAQGKPPKPMAPLKPSTPEPPLSNSIPAPKPLPAKHEDASMGAGTGPKPLKPKKSGLFPLIISIIIVVGAGVAGYFFVLPIFVGDDGGSTTPTNTETSPVVNDTPPVATNGGLFDTPPTGEPTPPITVEPPAVPLSTYVSQVSLSGSPEEVLVSSYDVASIRDSVPFTSGSPSLKEVLLQDPDTGAGDSMTVEQFGTTYLPSFFDGLTALNFESSFTYLVYTDAKGAWPVYVMRVSPDVSVSEAKSAFADIENASVSSLGNLYLQSPGGAGGWTDGNVGGNPGRYIVFTQDGAALSYTFVNDEHLVLATNYAAAQETVKRLAP